MSTGAAEKSKSSLFMHQQRQHFMHTAIYLRDPPVQCMAPIDPEFPVGPINRINEAINRYCIVDGNMRFFFTCNCICFFGGIAV